MGSGTEPGWYAHAEQVALVDADSSPLGRAHASFGKLVAAQPDWFVDRLQDLYWPCYLALPYPAYADADGMPRDVSETYGSADARL